MTNPLCVWPYAAKPYIQFEFKVNLLVIWITFRFSMNTDLIPAANLFTVKVDGIDKNVVGVNWVDEYTLSFQVTNIPAHPTRVLSYYHGPSEDLRIRWDKQWEPWGKILCSDVPLDWEHILDVNVPNKIVTINGTLLLSSNIILAGTYNDLDVAGVNILYLNAGGGNITINGFSNGIRDQLLYLVIIMHGGNSVKLTNENVAGDQLIFLHAGGDETLTNEYGGWNLICPGYVWFDVSHAKHV